MSVSKSSAFLLQGGEKEGVERWILMLSVKEFDMI
jgi:hypothetical protein